MVRLYSNHFHGEMLFLVITECIYNGISLGMKMKLGKQYEYIISEVLELFKGEYHEGEGGEVTRGESSGECGVHRPGGMVAPQSHA